MTHTAALTACPDCGCPAPAAITERFIAESTDGPLEHVRVACAGGHWFLMPASLLRGAA